MVRVKPATLIGEPGARRVSPFLFLLAIIGFFLVFTGVSCNTDATKSALRSLGGSAGITSAQSAALDSCLDSLKGVDFVTYNGWALVFGKDPTVVSLPASCEVSTGTGHRKPTPRRRTSDRSCSRSSGSSARAGDALRDSPRSSRYRRAEPRDGRGDLRRRQRACSSSSTSCTCTTSCSTRSRRAPVRACPDSAPAPTSTSIRASACWSSSRSSPSRSSTTSSRLSSAPARSRSRLSGAATATVTPVTAGRDRGQPAPPRNGMP